MKSLCAAILLVSLSISSTMAVEIPRFTYINHPLHELPGVGDLEPTPVIMYKYSFNNQLGRLGSEGGIFAVSGATYNFQDEARLFCDQTDVLVIPKVARRAVNKFDFVKLHLNRPARVYVLLALDDPQNDPDGSYQLLNAPSDWVVTAAVTHESGSTFPLGEADRWIMEDQVFPQPSLPENGVIVELTLPPDNILVLPHYRGMKVNKKRVQSMAVLMAPSESTGFPLVSHQTPPVPSPFSSFLDSSDIVNPSADPPVPNTKCPAWLHDLYVVKERFGGSKYWRTWHPPIDPIYWCYFDHDHGSHPGLYRPMFHYTAWHTPDANTYRQVESHNGFKVYPFVVDDGRVVVMTLHVEMSKARRFYARHHTFIFSVHDPDGVNGGWDMEMELHMKMDFGPSVARFLNGTHAPFTYEGFQIADELSAIRHRASRNIAIINWENGADSLNPIFEYKTPPLLPRYEAWMGHLNCAKNMRLNSIPGAGFKWEFHNPQTAMRLHNSTAPDNIQRLLGNGMGRAIVLVGNEEVQIGDESYCDFTDLDISARGADGIFHTCAYFQTGLNSMDEWALRQFMIPGFQPVTVGGHRSVNNADPWNEIMAYDVDMVRKHNNMEMAINIFDN